MGQWVACIWIFHSSLNLSHCSVNTYWCRIIKGSGAWENLSQGKQKKKAVSSFAQFTEAEDT